MEVRSSQWRVASRHASPVSSGLPDSVVVLLTYHPGYPLRSHPLPPSSTGHQSVFWIPLRSLPPQHSGGYCSESCGFSPGMPPRGPLASRPASLRSTRYQGCPCNKPHVCPLLDVFDKYGWLRVGFGKKSRHTKATMYDVVGFSPSNLIILYLL